MTDLRTPITTIVAGHIGDGPRAATLVEELIGYLNAAERCRKANRWPVRTMRGIRVLAAVTVCRIREARGRR